MRIVQPATDEDLLVPPPAWRRSHHLRRGGWWADRPVRIDAVKAAAAGTAFLTSGPEWTEKVLRRERADPAVSEAGLAALADPENATPDGMAALLGARCLVRNRPDAELTAVAEHLMAARGVAFAVRVAAEVAGLRAEGGYSDGEVRGAMLRVTRTTYTRIDYFDALRPDTFATFRRRIRGHLATAPADDYAAAEAALTPYRDRAPQQRALASFLLPTREDWIAEDVAWLTAHRTGNGREDWATPIEYALLPSVRTLAQLDAVETHQLHFDWFTEVLENIGPAVLPRLLSALTRWDGADSRRTVFAAVAVIPTDDAYRALLDRRADRVVRPALHDATARFPRRALRLLAEAGADDLLRGHVARNPGLAAAVLPELTQTAAGLIRAALAETGTDRDAPADRVPAVLGGPGPVVSAWVDAETLPRIALRDGSGVLPVASVRRLVTLLATADPRVTGVRDALVPGALRELGWELFTRWQDADAPAKDGWALTSLGLSGDDETVRRLAPVIRAWPGKSGHARAVHGLDVLTAIGTETALMHLHGISQNVRFRGLKEQAEEKVRAVADRLGLTPERLADRLVPRLGLAADGTLTLDYGPRWFRAGFDEQLRPYVTDAAGKRLKALPRPGASDDAEKASAAYARYAALKKDVRVLARDQLTRLEAAMADRRRWTAAEFRAHLADHPLLGHLVRRLVWGVYADGTLCAAFRVAEDRSLAGPDDEEMTLADDALVGVAHPVELGTVWGEVFSDYEILQPFPQLGREVFTPADAELPTDAENRALLALEKRGWRRGEPGPGGQQQSIGKTLPGGVHVELELSPGIPISDPHDVWADSQEVSAPRLTIGDRRNVPLTDLDPVTASELLRDLATLAAER
ncbi:hypothetical protein J2S43_006152 [Catenuloplanes nepalensis]|uniref:DUF4132 domain-containing protein n=1 Tax=Catenuloplanes nepalensis TaxID=587533 RepID=A0ABT9N233_9ACTN|nr:DUF4132 domain-containing protein [Catenuloplanes nepalensis]MDP9797640.1 hypothetical protein [Catenuloplanes nepalensis]